MNQGVNVSDDLIGAFQRDGVVLIKGLFKDDVEKIRAGIDRNMSEPGPYASENLKEGEAGRFFDEDITLEGNHPRANGTLIIDQAPPPFLGL